MTALMTAYRLTHYEAPPEFVEVPVPEPGPGEVLVKVGGVGLCHSDLLFLDAPEGAFPYTLPFTLGHEIGGWVERPGPGVTGVSPGDGVVLSSHLACGHCSYCRRGYDNYCTAHGLGLGFGRDGGLAQFVVAQRRSLVRLDGLDPRHAGPLADAGYTSYHAVKKLLPKLVPGSTAVVIGVGGLGGYAVQYLRLLTAARVIAVDVAQHRLDAIAGLGAETVLSDASVTARLVEMTGGSGAEGVFDFVGSDATVRTALTLSRPLGSVAIVGAGGGTAPVSWPTVARECEVFIPQGGTVADLQEVVALAEQGTLRMLDELFAFADTPEAYSRLRANQLRGRAVVTPNG
jgi:propanol-preferring alcohol dehydrogenase